MATKPDPIALRKRIGTELKRHRYLAKRSAHEAAEELGCSRGKISQMEIGFYRLHFRDVRDLLLFYGAPPEEVERLVGMAKDSALPSWWEPYAEVVEDWFAFFLGSEGEAIREFNYEQQVIPGLLQTPEYAEAVTEASNTVRMRDRQKVVDLRLARQRRLHEDEPLALTAVVEETALRRPIGSPAVRRAQLEHLLIMGELPNVGVQVILTEVGAHSGMAANNFIVLEFADYNPGVYLEHPPVVGARYDVEAPELASTYMMIAKELQTKALDEHRSAEFIRKLIAQLK
ncbi:helix-turn-helix domain-containing protein [Saccharothrix coeruleofusca]|uniref:Transcriptional regulator n=1 Tax=Saccharothrix coeruleofusca TaxID=33919 RepID=A0A918ALZ6_9PSEU|nr:helix-turn-helix transcriptional regulator [Saccharothrix coeruleofusca]MBP2339561.1 transcriptional regulator with XRE-family HTH domain [Saccharothrix coeruleofusca]GGP56848.1 transcriptional regulator [Saccharothrix coeruleofusca]